MSNSSRFRNFSDFKPEEVTSAFEVTGAYLFRTMARGLLNFTASLDTNHAGVANDLLSVGQAARLLGCSSSTVHNHIKARRIVTVRTEGGQHRIARRQLDSFLEASNGDIK